jgi:MFS family permease
VDLQRRLQPRRRGHRRGRTVAGRLAHRQPGAGRGAAFAQQLPWLLFSLPAGAYVDRLDRRRLLVAVNLARGALLAGLALAVWGGVATIPVLFAAFFLFGTGETLADSTSVALLPSIVPPAALARANARLLGAYLVGNQLGRPAVRGVAVRGRAGAAVRLRRRQLPGRGPAGHSTPPAPRPRARRRGPAAAHAARGGRRGAALAVAPPHPAAAGRLRGVMNLAGAGTFAIWVLLARERLGLHGVGFGALVTAYSVGGLLGTMVAGRLEATLGPAVLLRAGLLAEAACQLSLALTRISWVAGATLVLFGAHATVWGVVAVSLRQRLVPERLRGRVNSVYFLIDLGGAALGTLVGGLVAQAWGITAPRSGSPPARSRSSPWRPGPGSGPTRSPHRRAP